MSRAVVGRYAGRLDWERAVARNLAAADRTIAGGPQHVLVFEPAAPVLSLGRRSVRGDLDAASATVAATRGARVVPDDRGGRATLHLPGQLVALVALRWRREAIGQLVDGLLGAVAELAHEAGTPVERRDGEALGLWMGDDKVASIGLRHRDGVALHGVAVNVAVQRDWGEGLELCGAETRRLGSLHNLTDRDRIPLLAANLLRRVTDLAAHAR